MAIIRTSAEVPTMKQLTERGLAPAVAQNLINKENAKLNAKEAPYFTGSPDRVRPSAVSVEVKSPIPAIDEAPVEATKKKKEPEN